MTCSLAHGRMHPEDIGSCQHPREEREYDNIRYHGSGRQVRAVYCLRCNKKLLKAEHGGVYGKLRFTNIGVK
jgi:hypothetical protein